jgi:hypothetical protein
MLDSFSSSFTSRVSDCYRSLAIGRDKIHLPQEVITLAAAVNTIQTKNITAGLIVLKCHRSICHKSAKIIGHNVSLTKKYSVILIYFRPMANDR